MNDQQNKTVLRFLPIVGRWLLGLPLVLFGLMNFFHPMAAPTDLAEGAKAFSLALHDTGYMMPMIGVLFLVAGPLLLLNRFVPLALLLLAPFFLNSVLFHLFLERTGLPMALVFALLELTLAWSYRGVFVNVLRARNSIGGA